MLSEAVALIETEPDTVLPLEGDVTETVGGVVSVADIACEQEAVEPPPEPTQLHRYCVDVSVTSEKVPAVQAFRVKEQTPFTGVGDPDSTAVAYRVLLA
jgi:hypothetical protein